VPKDVKASGRVAKPRATLRGLVVVEKVMPLHRATGVVLEHALSAQVTVALKWKYSDLI
jgi:hypothetical protein